MVHWTHLMKLIVQWLFPNSHLSIINQNQQMLIEEYAQPKTHSSSQKGNIEKNIRQVNKFSSSPNLDNRAI
ncbi:hypothetical protein SNEBB_002201 [Seison nebaliae]|nr:hypothetical protein SNEBB_002201 [Seison nebaliae]